MSTGEARSNPRVASEKPAGAGRVVRNHVERCRAPDSSRHHTLAIAEFFRLLPFEHFFPVNHGRNAFRRTRRARNALGHQSGMHGTRDARSRLARRDASLARKVLVEQRGRRRNSGHGVEFFSLRAARRARTRDKFRVERTAAATAASSLTPRRKRTPRSRRP